MSNNFGSWPDDDDNDGAGLTDEFCAQIDSIVEHHNKNATVILDGRRKSYSSPPSDNEAACKLQLLHPSTKID